MTNAARSFPGNSSIEPAGAGASSSFRSSLRTSKAIWPWGYLSEYVLTGTVSHSVFLTLVDRAINHVLPPEVLALGTIDDMKGVDRNPEPGEDSPEASSKSTIEEVVCLAGQYTIITEKEEKESAFSRFENVSLQPFRMYLLSSFDQFPASAHIRHKLGLAHHGYLPPEATLQSISIQPEVILYHLRIGIELFDSRFVGELGRSPVADQRLILEAAPGKFRLSLVGEALADKTDLPLERGGLMERLNAVFLELFKFDIKKDHLGKPR